VREKLRDSYSETGRPSIDPELLLRILLIGYLYGVTSERKLVEELRMHLVCSEKFLLYLIPQRFTNRLF
jgi:transposase